jgi:hypothetical protein
MSRRKSIAGAIKHAAQGIATPPPPPPQQPTEPSQQPAERRFKASTRQGKKMIAAPIDPAAHRQLKMLAAESGQKSEDLIREALRDLFAKYGKPPIA